MDDKDTMPKEIWAYETNCKGKGFGHWYDEDVSGEGKENQCIKYTRLDPDYIVISRKELKGMKLDNPTVHGGEAHNRVIDKILAKK